MSNILYTESPMSFEEKSTWIMAVISPVAYAVYLLNVQSRLEHAPVDEVAYVWPLVVSIVAAIIASIVAHIGVSILNPKEAEQRDERDAHINRLGTYVASFVMAIGTANALILALAEFAHFWIANTIYATFVLTDVTSSMVKIVGYRRGF